MDRARIKQSKEVIVSADKTDNHYLIPIDYYKWLLMENITKNYRKDSMSTVNKINRDAATIARELQLDDRIEAAKITCRLINPTKSNISVISKNILDRIN